MCLDLPISIKAFTIYSCGFYGIYVNSRHSSEQNRKSVSHELMHIENGDYDKECDVDKLEYERHLEMRLI